MEARIPFVDGFLFSFSYQNFFKWSKFFCEAFDTVIKYKLGSSTSRLSKVSQFKFRNSVMKVTRLKFFQSRAKMFFVTKVRNL